jgi:hypothetical protein
MAWIESHTVLARHRKTIELAFDLQVKPVQIIGHLHALWHTVLEQQEDGDLSRWSNYLIAQSALWDGEPDEFVTRLRERGWLDGSLVHDWIDYVGPYLTKKYSSGNPARLKEIWAKHGYKYGKGQGKYVKQKATPKRVESECKERLPNPSLPNPSEPDRTKPKEQDARTDFDQFWEAYPKKIGKKAAERAWKQAKDRPLLVDLLQVLEIAKQSEQWRKENGQFIPNPSTWLNQGRWADVYKIEGLSPPKPVLVGPKAFQKFESVKGDFAPMPEDFLDRIGKPMPTLREA